MWISQINPVKLYEWLFVAKQLLKELVTNEIKTKSLKFQETLKHKHQYLTFKILELTDIKSLATTMGTLLVINAVNFLLISNSKKKKPILVSLKIRHTQK